MKNAFPILLIVLALACKPTPPYNVIAQQSNTDALLIGLHPVNDQIVWASGTKSTVILTIDGGESWQTFEYPDADTLQFRDIHSWGDKEALVLSIGEGSASAIYSFHLDSGWTVNYRMPFEKGFLDAIDFWDNGRGIAYGDAIDSLPFILKTMDFGKSWERVISADMPNAGVGEGGFASSGTCVETGTDGKVWIGTGAGGNARILFSEDYGNTWQAYATPMVTGDAAGITSVRFDGKVGFITGGDLTKREEWSKNVFWSDTEGKSWYPLPQPKTAGSMYGSGFAKVGDQYVTLICGPGGADLSMSIGQPWTKISPKEFWTATLLPSGIGWMAGKKGALVKVVID
jgi:photosystem II stability/assembly factor-like uncharacterized protein